MRRYLEKGKQWIRIHRRSRRHAALQNLCFTLLLLALSAVLLRGYIAANSVEAAVEKWCEENLFGEAEILSILTYEEEQHNQKEVVIGKELSNGDRYEAKLFMDRKNPLKWENTGCSYFTEAIDYMVDEELIEKDGEFSHVFPRKAVQGIFPELTDVSFVFARYMEVQFLGDEGRTEGRYPGFEVYLEYDETEVKPEALLYNDSMFRLNLETGEIVHSEFKTVTANGKKATLWMSEERMEFIAEKLMEALPQED